MKFEELNDLIQSLEVLVNATDPERGYWRQVWTLVHQVGDGFKGTRFNTAEERQNAWSAFSALVGQAKERSERQKTAAEERKRIWEDKQRRSEQSRNRVQHGAQQSELRKPLNALEELAGFLVFPFNMLDTIVARILGAEDPDSLNALRGELQESRAKLKEAWDLFRREKDTMLPNDRNQAYESLKKAGQQIDDAWARWKERYGIFKEKRHQEFLERKERRRDRQRKHEEWQHRHEEYLQRVQANIHKLEEKLEKQRGFLERQSAHLGRLQEQYDSAYSDSFRDRCADWISEAEEKIRDAEGNIERLEEWLREAQAKLSE